MILADYVLIKRPLDVRCFHQAKRRLHLSDGHLQLTINDRFADIYTGIANKDARTSNDLPDLRLRLAAEGAEGQAS